MYMLQVTYPDNPYSVDLIWYGIFFILVVAALFLGCTFIQRWRKLRYRALKARYQYLIDKLLFNYIFKEQHIHDVLKVLTHSTVPSRRLFQKVAIKSIVSLHQNYSGEYQRKLEEFYIKSGLVEYSKERLKSRKWVQVVEGIRDLSNLNVPQILGDIEELTTNRNELIRTEAIVGLIRLKGARALDSFSKMDLYLNDWVQSNILFTLKKHSPMEPENIGELFSSTNVSVQFLAVRIIDMYQSSSHQAILLETYNRTDNPKLRSEIRTILEKFNHITNPPT